MTPYAHTAALDEQLRRACGQTTFYDFSGGMESAAMLVVDRDRIGGTGADTRAHVGV
jgi:hypothetical protein